MGPDLRMTEYAKDSGREYCTPLLGVTGAACPFYRDIRPKMITSNFLAYVGVIHISTARLAHM
jgi:hypothetical protein